jgi:hypothetical protein
MNNMPKHAGQATVASFDSQYWHCGASDEMAAPQFGQLRVCACMVKVAHLCRRRARLSGACSPARTLPFAAADFLSKNAGRIDKGCAMLTLHFHQYRRFFFATLRRRVNISFASGDLRMGTGVRT